MKIRLRFARSLSFVSLSDTSAEIAGAEDVTIQKIDGIWQLEGEWLKRVAATVNFSDYESRLFFDKVLRNAGLFDRLEDLGVENGDTVCIYDLVFDYQY